MKIRLSQSKCGSTGRIQRSLDPGHELLLGAFHFGGASRGFVIKAKQVKEAMHDVEAQLEFHRGSEGARLALRRFDTDHDLAMLKRDDVRRTRFIKETLMQFGHAPVGNQDNVYLFESCKHAGFPSRQLQTFGQGELRETLETRQFNPHPALPITNRYRRHRHVSGRDSAWKFRVIKRAPLLNVT